MFKMHNVTDDEVDYILNDLEKKGIVTEDVRYNILDHVCCIIENEMSVEMNFYEFYKDTIAKFYKRELSEIEAETQVLLTFKNYYAMKRTLKISGITSIALVLIGAVLKTMHWPGAGIAIVLGLIFFSLVFIPLNIVLKFKDDKEKNNRLIMTIGMLTAATSTIGVLFKIMSWPYANVFKFTGLYVCIYSYLLHC